MRPKQWVKNGFLFVALIFDRQLTNVNSFLTIIAGFAIFSLLASTIYILNDLMDIEADRQHPRKRNRPIPSGQLSTTVAAGAASLFVLIALPAAYLLNQNFFLICLLYLITNLSYSRWLKHVAILDVLLIASFYVMRVGAGVALLITVERFSPWLYVFTTFIALYLGIGKRRAELAIMAGGDQTSRKVLEGYTLPFLDQLLVIVSAMTIMTYSLYTFSAPNLPANHTMMLTIPFLIYGIFRYLFLIQTNLKVESPEEILFTDKPIQIAVLMWLMVIIFIFYIT